MTHFLKKVFTLILAALLVLSPLAVQAQSLLQGSLEEAYQGGQCIKAAISLELDDDLGLLMQPEETFTMIQKILHDSSLVVYTVKGEADIPEFGFLLAIQEQEVVNGRAWLQDGTLLVTTSLLPGKTLAFQSQEVMQALQDMISPVTDQVDNLQVISGALEKYLTIIMMWMDGTEGMMYTSEEPVPATDQRDSASASTVLTVTPEQLKELLVALAQEFAQDEELQQAFGAADAEEGADMGQELLQAAQEYEPTGDDMVWSLFMDDQGDLVGIDGLVPATFWDVNAQGTVTFNRKTKDAQVLDDFSCKLEDEDGGVISLRVSVSNDETDAQAPKGSFYVRFFQQAGKDADSTDVILMNEHASTIGADRETTECQMSIELTAKAGATQDGDAEAVLQSMMSDTYLSAEVGITSDTQSRGDGFTSEIVVDISFSGLKLGRVRVTFSTDAYTPIDTSGYEVVNVFSLDDESSAALSEELYTGLALALINAMPVLPPELQQMMMQDE